MTRTAVYRMRSATGQLLYIGQSQSPTTRMQQLIATAPWMCDVATISLEWHDSRAEAVEAEAEAIRRERPRYNVQHGRRAPSPRKGFGKPCCVPELLAEIAAFCERSSMSAATFGKEAMGDPRFVYDIRSGRQCLPRTVEKARAFIAAHAGRAA